MSGLAKAVPAVLVGLAGVGVALVWFYVWELVFLLPIVIGLVANHDEKWLGSRFKKKFQARFRGRFPQSSRGQQAVEQDAVFGFSGWSGEARSGGPKSLRRNSPEAACRDVQCRAEWKEREDESDHTAIFTESRPEAASIRTRLIVHRQGGLR